MPRAATNGLKVVTRPGTAQLWIRGTIRGRRVYESAGTADAGIAEQVRRAREDALWREVLDGERAASAPHSLGGHARRPVERTFAEAVESYLREYPPRPTQARDIGKLLDVLEDRPLSSIRKEALLESYAAILTPKAGNATKVRHVLTPLRAILRHAAESDWCVPVLFKSPKVGKPQTEFLRPKEARALVDAAADHLKPLFVFLFCTGARSSEAIELDWRDVDLRGSRATLTVKGIRVSEGTRRQRHVDLPPACVAALASLGHREGRLFRPHKGGKVSGDAYWDSDRTGGGQFKKGWAGAHLRAGLPGRWRTWTPQRGGTEMREWVPDASPHATRHSWASWHYCVHRDLLLLRTVGDWSSVTLCERYAHLMPEVYASEALAFWGQGGAAVREVG